MLLEKRGRPNVLMRIAQMSGEYHPDQLTGWDDLYESFEAFEEDDDRY